MSSPFVVDATLREGAQSPRARLTRRRQLAILRGLAEVGIEEAEIGWAAPDADLPGLVRAVRRVAPELRLSIWCRGLPADIAIAAAAEPDVVHASLPVSRLHLERRLRRSPSWLLEQIPRAAESARRAGARRLSLGLEDATRAEAELIAAACERARAAGYERVRLADTVSAATPASIASLIQLARAAFGGPVGVHCHDDFAMATGNAVAALEAGAAWADGCLLGGGERAGTARTEALCAWLAVHRQAPYRLQRLPGLCRRAARALGRTLPAHAPVVGDAIWQVASGLHIDGLCKDAETYQPFPPSLLGRSHLAVLGPLSGRAAVRHVLRALGRESAIDDALVACVRRGSWSVALPLP
ncbi:MAG: hypothetical protein N3B15_05820 [Planctomycetota bacterium]|nr:hypothetical protein [Planctomycetota bacterium]